MGTTPVRDPLRGIVRLATGAALIAVLLPLLPWYGGSSESIFSLGLPLRVLISFLLGSWTNAAVVAVGILFLKRDRVGVAAGVFVAVAMTLAITIAHQVLDTAPNFGPWQTVLFLVLQIIEGVLLAFAAARAIDAASAASAASTR
ncbi:MAG: hypothetical protein ACRDGK_05975 [Actinomycetota bacterium]